MLFEKKNADAHYKSCLSCSMLYKLFEKFYELFEKKNADAHYKSCFCCSMLYKLFEKKNADAHYKKLFKLFPVVHVV